MKTNDRLAVLVAIFASCGVMVSAAQAVTPLTTERVASGMNRPVLATHSPDDPARLFIVEKRGVIRILDLTDDTLNGTAFLDINSRVINLAFGDSDERGLLGLAFHPNYRANGLFYVYYTNNSGNSVVARYSRTTADTADFNSESILLTINQPQTNHNGGWLGFSPVDGYLYIASGDGGGGGDNDAGHTIGVGNGQDFNNLLGAMLRIDVDGGSPFAIPADNPFVGVAGDDEIWAYGLRNPWRNAFDLVTGALYMADVGQGSWEEINFQSASSAGGENYGWRCREGAHNFNGNGDCSATPFTDPVQEYGRGGIPFRCAITGGEVYRGCAIPDLRGTYFYADFCSDQIWSFRYDASTETVTEFTERTSELDPSGALSIADIVSFGLDADGEMYIVEQGIGTAAGEVFRIVPSAAADAPTPNDYDNDGDVDLDDLEAFVGCLDGPGVPFTDCLCDVFDNGDSVVDLQAFQSFQDDYTGS